MAAAALAMAAALVGVLVLDAGSAYPSLVAQLLLFAARQRRCKTLRRRLRRPEHRPPERQRHRRRPRRLTRRRRRPPHRALRLDRPLVDRRLPRPVALRLSVR